MNHRGRAFTLIELLVTIAIIAMLIGILLPTLNKARAAAKANVCLSTLKNIGTSVAIYHNENRDQFFPYRLPKLFPASNEDYFNEYDRLQPRWQWFIETEDGPVINPKPFIRLGRPWGDTDLFSQGKLGTKMTTDIFTCPSLDDPEFEHNIRDGAYGYNYQYLGNTRSDTQPKRWDNYSVGLHRIKSPARTIIFADSRGSGRIHGKHSYTLDPPRLGLEVNAQRFGPAERWVPEGLDKTIYQYSPAEGRHNSLANVSFVDSHAEAMSLKQMGYQVHDGSMFQGIPKNVPLPLPHPFEGPYTATNQLWNGQGTDPIALEANNQNAP